MSDLSLRLGRLPAKRPFGLGDLVEYVQGKLPAPPAFVHYGGLVHDGFPMDGNGPDPNVTNQGPDFQGLGDCTIAAAAHCIQLWNVEAKESDPVPTANEVVSTYLDLTGGVDSGLAEADVLQVWHSTGLWNNKIKGYAPIPANGITPLHQAAAFYGAVYLGVEIPQSAMDQFTEGVPWTVVPNSPIEGGHAIPISGYDQHYVYVITWGRVQPVTYPWLAAYLEEAWCVLPEEFAQRGRGPIPTIDFASLQADLKAV